MEWLVFVVIVLSIVLFFKLSHVKHKIGLMIFLVVVFFIYFTFNAVANNNSILLNNTSGVIDGVKSYSLWLGQAFENFKAITGKAMGMDWFPENTSIVSDVYKG